MSGGDPELWKLLDQLKKERGYSDAWFRTKITSVLNTELLHGLYRSLEPPQGTRRTEILGTADPDRGGGKHHHQPRGQPNGTSVHQPPAPHRRQRGAEGKQTCKNFCWETTRVHADLPRLRNHGGCFPNPSGTMHGEEELEPGSLPRRVQLKNEDDREKTLAKPKRNLRKRSSANPSCLLCATKPEKEGSSKRAR